MRRETGKSGYMNEAMITQLLITKLILKRKPE